MNLVNLLLGIVIGGVLWRWWQKQRGKLKRWWQKQEESAPRHWHPKSEKACPGCQAGFQVAVARVNPTVEPLWWLLASSDHGFNSGGALVAML